MFSQFEIKSATSTLPQFELVNYQSSKLISTQQITTMSNSTSNKPTILDFMTATGGEAEQSVNEISRKYVVCGREWTSKVAAATSASLEGGESISLSEYEKNIVSSLSDECARLEVEAMALMARPKGDDDVFGEDDDADDDDLSCYAEEEAQRHLRLQRQAFARSYRSFRMMIYRKVFTSLTLHHQELRPCAVTTETFCR